MPRSAKRVSVDASVLRDSKTASNETKVAAKAAAKTGKRKAPAKDEEHECGSSHEDEEAEDNTPAKRRKTGTQAAKKTDDDMPLADRVAVSSLKRAMYIGAHVSAAGGMSLGLPTEPIALHVTGGLNRLMYPLSRSA